MLRDTLYVGALYTSEHLMFRDTLCFGTPCNSGHLISGTPEHVVSRDT